MLEISLFILALNYKYLSYNPFSRWYSFQIENVDVYWEESVRDYIPKIAAYIQKAVEYVEDYSGRKVTKFTLVIFFEEDGTKISFIYNPDKIFLLNLGGLRVDNELYLKKIKDIITTIVACSLFDDFPSSLGIFPPDFFVHTEVMISFCEYFSLDDDNFYFQGSINSQVIKFLEKKYGKRFVFDLFLNNKVSLRDLSEYKKEYLSWKIRTFHEVTESDNQNLIFSNSRGIAFAGGDLFTISGGYIVNVSNDKKIFKVRGSNWLSGGGEFVVFDSENEQGFFNIFIITNKLNIKKIDIPARAWYPAVYPEGDNVKIIFIKKLNAYDELCETDLSRTDLIGSRDKVEIASFNCFLRSGELEEFLTPSISPDGKKIAFSVKRKNDFIDLAIYDLEFKELFYVTQDSYTDIFPSWYDSDTLLFSSDRHGIFSLFAYKIGTGEIHSIAKSSEGILETFSYNGKIYAVLVSGDKTSIAELSYNEKKMETSVKEPLFIEMLIVESNDVKFSIDKFGVLPFYFFVSDAGFINSALNVYLSDKLFRNPIFFGFKYRFPFSIYSKKFENLREKLGLKTNSIEGVDDVGGMLGFSILSLLRVSNPYIYASLEYIPFSEIFVRELKEDGMSSLNLFHERQFNSSLFGIYLFTKLWIIFGGRFSSVNSEINDVNVSSTFWNMIRSQYDSFGFGNFISPEIGIFLRTARKSFFLSSGLEVRAFTGVNVSLQRYRRIPTYLDFSASYFSPELYRLILEFNINGFLRFYPLGRFKGKFGSLDIPFYYSPPYNLDPLLRFEPIIFNLENLKWDVGLIRGVRRRYGDIALIPSLRAYINIFNSVSNYIFDIERINFVPFLSYAVFSPDSAVPSRPLNFLSFGTELDIETTIFFTSPFTFKFGVARGEVTEFYFSIFISVGNYWK